MKSPSVGLFSAFIVIHAEVFNSNKRKQKGGKAMNEHVKHINKTEFQADILGWYQQVKRDFPFRGTKNPYHILVSEIMSQQTQITAVVPYYNKFIALFPTTKELAHTDEATLLKAWEGLGYYSRARNLQASAKMVEEAGHFPNTYHEILQLKGVGPYTAAAVASIVFNEPTPAIDGNVFRVISRLGAIFDDITKPATRKVFEACTSTLICEVHPGDFNQSLIELGALICTPKSPKCLECPVRTYCLAYQQGIDDQLPVKKKAVQPTKVRLVVGVVENEWGEWLIGKRPETGLLANFYAFKQFEYEAGEPEDVLVADLIETGCRVREVGSLGFSKHVFSHRVWEMEAYQVTVDAAGYVMQEGELWVRPGEMKNYPLAIAHVRIVEGLLR